MNRSLVVAALGLLATGCPPKGGGARPYPAPAVATVQEKLKSARDAMTSFRGDSTMDYWLSGQRAKGEVLVMGSIGKKIRFAALSPAGGSTLAEMACDGTNFVYLDYQNNCVMTGPCDARSIATFFNIALEPDDFLHLALGTPPTLDGATGTVTWDAKAGVERVVLESAEGKQKLTLDARDTRWDVLDSELIGSDGKTRWSVANTDFEKVSGSGERRVPKKTRFKSPAQNQDLLVEWNELEVNVVLQPEQFVIEIPPGLGRCGQQAPAAGAPAGATSK
jgi:outer membrane lipoprotein-sorting protein